MHVALMHAYCLAVSETRLINTSSNWYSASFSVIQTLHQRPLTYKADISTQARQATYQKPFENKEPNLNLFANSEGVTAVILYWQYFANSERLKSHKVITPLISKTLSSLRCQHSSCFSWTAKKSQEDKVTNWQCPREQPNCSRHPHAATPWQESALVPTRDDLNSLFTTPTTSASQRAAPLPPGCMNGGSNKGAICCSLSLVFLRMWVFPGSCSYIAYQPRRDLSGHSFLWPSAKWRSQKLAQWSLLPTAAWKGEGQK